MQKFESEPESTHVGCMFCQIACRSAGGEGAHMNHTHAEIHPVRKLIGTTQCSACLTAYHTHGKFKAHLIRSQTCRTTIVGRGHWETPRPGIGSIADTARHKIWDNRLPALCALGPLPQGVSGRDFPVEHEALFEEITLANENETQIRGSICALPISWTKCRATLQEVSRCCSEELIGIPADQRDRFCAVLHRLAESPSWPFLFEQTTKGSPSIPQLDTLTTLIEQCTVLETEPRALRPIGRERVFLHAFSGRRRLGGLQHYLEAAFARDSQGLILKCTRRKDHGVLVERSPCWLCTGRIAWTAL